MQVTEAVAAVKGAAEQERRAIQAATDARVDKGVEERAAALQAEADKKVERMRLEHADALSNLQRRAEREAEALKAAHREAQQELDAARAAAPQKEQEIRQRYDAKLAELQANHAESRRQTAQEQAAALKALETAQSQKEQALAIAAERGQKLAAEAQRHEQEVNGLRAAQTELLKAEGDLRAALQRASEEVAYLRSTLQQQVDSHAREAEAAEKARSEEGGAMAALKKHHEDQMGTLQRVHRESLARRDSEIALLRRAVEELAQLRAAVGQIRQRHPEVYNEIVASRSAEKADAEKTEG
jgi:hypothetical protein